MKYEVRMKGFFEWRSKRWGIREDRLTLIEIIDAADLTNAYIRAKQVKDETMKQLMSGFTGTVEELYKISITIDAVVAKPKLDIISEEPKAIYHNMIDVVVLEKKHIEKLYNDLIDVQAKIKARTNDMTGDYIINWWLAILQKLLAKNFKIGG